MNRQIEEQAIASLQPYERNTRIHSDSQVDLLVRSIQEYGWTVPVLVDEQNVVIAGHGRIEAAKRMGLERVPTIRLGDLTPEQVRAYRIADNRLTDLGEWDTGLLAQELDSLKDLDFDLELTGFNLEDLARMMPPEEEAEATPEPPAEPITQLGDVWVLGGHRLVCGDSTDKETVTRLLAGETPNLMVTDPPYGVEYDATWRTVVSAKRADLKSYDGTQRLGSVQNDNQVDWSATFRAYPQANVAYVWGPSLSLVPPHMLTENDFDLRTQIIWRKPNFVFSRGHYHWQHEVCWYAVRKGKPAAWIGDRSQSTIWDIGQMAAVGHSHDEGDVRTEHSTQKPVECMERPIRNHSGDVYDPFCGSGTTIIAAERQNRRCFAIELDPAYCDVIVERWENYTGGKAKRV